ncbi:MAG: hypothetical protein Q9M43_07015 [Sulfurimonas sp.]|nr:hypothetical protein [Sulfurimonas sp.]
MKQTIIIKDSKTMINICSDYLIVKSQSTETVIGYIHIKEIYLNKLIDISIAHAIKLSSYFDVYFIDRYGKILAKVDNYEEV